MMGTDGLRVKKDTKEEPDDVGAGCTVSRTEEFHTIQYNTFQLFSQCPLCARPHQLPLWSPKKEKERESERLKMDTDKIFAVQ